MTDLGFSLEDLTRVGRRPAELTYVVSRELTAEDLAALSARTTRNPYQVEKITERHHTLARLIASGLKQSEAAAIVGYSQMHVSMLMDSPAFRELMIVYSNAKDLEFADFAGRLAGLGKDAIVELQTRFEEKPEEFSNSMLLELVTKLGDRSGFGPQTKNTQVNINVDLGSRLAAARLRAREAAMKTIPSQDSDA